VKKGDTVPQVNQWDKWKMNVAQVRLEMCDRGTEYREIQGETECRGLPMEYDGNGRVTPEATGLHTALKVDPRSKGEKRPIRVTPELMDS